MLIIMAVIVLDLYVASNASIFCEEICEETFYDKHYTKTDHVIALLFEINAK